jgi:hypothetical protein
MIEQVAIALTGVTAIFLTQSRSERVRKYACLFGMVGQPFWMFSAATAEQWGILLLTFFYTFAWAKGVWTHWIRPAVPTINPLTRAGYAFTEAGGGKPCRLVMGFESLDELNAAHDEVIRLRRAALGEEVNER